MGKVFDLESPLMTFLTKVADLIILNLVALICSLPIVTIGASWTAMHYVTIRMAKHEDGYIVKGFFKSFKENFKQATIIWLLMLAVFILIVGDFVIFRYATISIPTFVRIIVMVISVFILCVCMYIFPVLARFDNSIKATIKNAFLMSILNLPRTILMAVIYLLPIALIFLTEYAVPLLLMMGSSVPAYLASLSWKKIFEKYEPEQEEISNEYQELEIFREDIAE